MPARGIQNDLGGAHHHDVAPGTIAGHAAPHGDASTSFTPTQASAYPFHCSVPGHRETGMTGTLTVE
jgi:uncharacterized cupredoxin-like copper-binding protein